MTVALFIIGSVALTVGFACLPLAIVASARSAAELEMKAQEIKEVDGE